MSPNNYTELNFEEHIETELLNSGYIKVDKKFYDKSLCLIPSQLIEFIQETQPKRYKKLTEQHGDNINTKLTKRISDQIESKGVIEVLRKGVKDRGSHFDLVYFQPKSGLNPEHQDLYKKNRFIEVRQVYYSNRNENSIDMGIFINGIPIMMLELKNSLTGQNHTHGIKQWKFDRDPKESLFKFKRNMVYFSVGNEKVSMTTRLSGSKTRFLPFNKGIDNPVNPKGHMTHYLWDDLLQKDSVLDLIQNFVTIRDDVEKVYDPKQKRLVDAKSQTLIFPRFHQLKVINNLRKDILENGSGVNYLIQHTTGSGKSLSIGWLSHMLASLYQSPEDSNRIFDSVIVVTDRRVLDKQISNTIIQLQQVKGVVNTTKDENSEKLKEYIESGKSIIISTIQKFPVISEAISNMGDRKFAVIIDEVHSSQSGETSKHLKKSLSKSNLDNFQEGEDEEDLTEVDKLILDEINSRGRQPHISYFGFSGTPKNKTLELFGTKTEDGFKPFDLYSMKQSIAEGFTLDVLQNYTTYKRYFKINNEIKNDKELPEARVKSLLINWVDLQPSAITEKVRIILEHFTNNSANKLVGKARAMLVTKSRLHCVKYKLEFDKQMKAIDLPYRALVAFSGTIHDQETHQDYTETSMNGFPDNQTEENLKDPRFRFLIVNNKFQTGFDEPMLHSMYVDKKFGGLQCVQTLSRLNRTMKGKTDTFVLDFVNDPQIVQESFQPYYEGTVLEEETDPNRLYSIKDELDDFHLFSYEDVSHYAETFYKDDIPLEQLQGILDSIVIDWKELDEEQQELFRANLYSFIRLYSYISQIISFQDIELEKLFLFLRGLGKKLPRRSKDKLSDILSSIDLEYLKIEKKYTSSIELEEGSGSLEGIDGSVAGGLEEETTDLLSDIINALNESFDGDFSDEDKVKFDEIKQKIRDNEGLRQVMLGDNTETNKKDKFDRALDDLVTGLVDNNIDFYNKLNNKSINRILKDKLYQDYSESLKEAS
jgi:type I restriction enzyme, R subunit